MRIEIIENPTYHDYLLPDFKGNPLVESLFPPPETDENLIRRLRKKPQFDESELELPGIYRMILTNRLLTSFFFPCKQHLSLFRRLYIHITNGYKERNPITPAGQARLHNTSQPTYGKNVSGGNAEPITFVCGLSGVGKSSLVRRILQTIGHPVVRHSNYRGLPLCEAQILYLMRNIPDTGLSSSL